MYITDIQARAKSHQVADELAFHSAARFAQMAKDMAGHYVIVCPASCHQAVMKA
ncbi:hypothetical protein ACYX78_05720 [Advenella incenata]|jgi:hypothetical protein